MSKAERLTTMTLALLAMLVAFGTSQAQAQSTSLRNPLIPGVPTTEPYQAPYEGMPPPPGQGSTPAPVTQGMGGGPTLEPWNTRIPANQIDQGSSQVDLGVGPDVLAPPMTLGKTLTVPHAPSVPGADAGMLPGPLDFQPPPAAVVDINAQGGMPGDQAPQQRWGAQYTRDFGLRKASGSTLTDFGEKLTQKPNLKMNPQESQDGPRQAVYPGQMGSSTNRSPSIPGAQTTVDWYGNRRMFKGPTVRSVLTIAPY
jgi:hypothetical protein